MKLEHRFRLYLVLVHVIFAAGILLFLGDHRVWLVALEAFFVLSLVVGWRLVRDLTRPVGLLRNASRSLAEGDFTTRLRPVGPDEMDQLIDVYNRMIDRLREERIRNEEQESLLKRIVSVSPLAVVMLDLDNRIASVNPGAERLLAAPAADLIGRRLGEAGGPGAALEALPAGESKVLPLTGPRRARCMKLGFLDRGFTRHFVLVEELTEELRRSEKAAYDRLIRMLSHEVNNTSGAVSSMLQSCRGYGRQLRAEDNEDFEAALDVATSRLGRMNEVMKQFADVVRIPPPRKTPVSPVTLLRQIERLLRPGIESKGISWRNEGDLAPPAPNGLPDVAMDVAQMEQVLINIVRNAGEAMESGGTLTVRMERTASGSVLAIRDTGSGITPEVRDQIFTPFFTTKENGQGIGLTVVREILLGHGFPFSLESTGGGAEFRIVFPA